MDVRDPTRNHATAIERDRDSLEHLVCLENQSRRHGADRTAPSGVGGRRITRPVHGEGVGTCGQGVKRKGARRVGRDRWPRIAADQLHPCPGDGGRCRAVDNPAADAAATDWRRRRVLARHIGR